MPSFSKRSRPESAQGSESGVDPASRRSRGRRVGPAALTLVLVSVFLMAAGLVLPIVMGDNNAADKRPATTQDSPLGTEAPLTGLTPATTTPSTTGSPTSRDPVGGSSEEASASTANDWSQRWGPSIFRTGFSFFAGFSIGMALRFVLRTTLVAAGMALMLLLGLEYAGIIDVRWNLLAQHHGSAAAWASAQFSSLRTLLTGAVPSVAAALAGLAMGLRSR